MKRMVLGFAFNPLDNTVLLIRKNRPDWQAGKLNGIGGHVEEGETSIDAMVREFQEETGSYAPEFLWDYVGRMSDAKGEWHVSVYMVQGTRWDDIDHSKTDERSTWVKVDTLTALAAAGGCIENIPVLVALCLLPAAPPSNSRPAFALLYQ